MTNKNKNCKTIMRNMIKHLTLKVSHDEGISLSTLTFVPPPFSEDTYFCKVTDLNWTSVPSYIMIDTHNSHIWVMNYTHLEKVKIRALTSISPLGIPSNSEGLIHPSTTNHPPKLTALTFESPGNPST